MSKTNYRSSSPYAATTQTSWYISNYVHRPIPVSADDTPYTIPKEYENRPDLLSNKLYGVPDYYWVFYVRNRNLIDDPIWGLKVGLKIIVPSLETVKKATNS
jgi:hypothetical protein